MKKRKFSILLNISVLCLCLAAIAIGVYSVKTAQLNITGTIGFQAHNCDVKIVDYSITNASRDKSATTSQIIKTYLADSTLIDFPTDGMSITTNSTFNFGDLYFVDNIATDTVDDIKIKFTIENSSVFNVKATISSTELSNVGFVAYYDEWVIFGSNSDNNEKDIEITLSLQEDMYGNYLKEKIDTTSLSLVIDFEKTNDSATEYKQGVNVKTFTDEYISKLKTELGSYNYDDIGRVTTYEFNETNLSYAEKFPYYIEFGNNPKDNSKLKWLVVGKDNSGVLTKLGDEDINALSKGYMLNKNDYYLISEYYLPGVFFVNSFSQQWDDYLSEWYAGYYEYPESNIRNYLNGNVVKDNSTCKEVTETNSSGNSVKMKYWTPSGNDANFYYQYSFNKNNIFCKIKARTLKELGFSNNTESDKFWAYSSSELEGIFDGKGIESRYDMAARAYSIKNGYGISSYIYRTIVRNRNVTPDGYNGGWDSCSDSLIPNPGGFSSVVNEIRPGFKI